LITPVQLIVGLGNPGSQYIKTRHNVGVWYVEQLAEQQRLTLRLEAKLKGSLARFVVAEHMCWLFIPNTFMNVSGQAVKAIADFYRISPEAILVAHDELDFPPGDIRLKKDGGHGGHNGLRSIIEHLHTTNFLRLRIGIGHPGNRDQVLDYVLSRPSSSDQKQIMDAITHALTVTDNLIQGHWQKAMQQLHTGIIPSPSKGEG
jgi:PTH1 family peptidyl-tRNA hydrolase